MLIENALADAVRFFHFDALTDDVAAGYLVGTPGCREATNCHAPIIARCGDLEKGLPAARRGR
jgi:hypothetical protein